jgi:ABC-type uncharacterized transport system permease subunit
VRKASTGFWPELHAAISLVAYGAFALACVAGVMFLVQERHLKRHTLNSFFQNLPPIANLAVAVQRLMLAGFVLLTVGIVAGFFAGHAPAATVVLAVCVWLPYGVLLIMRSTHRISSRRVAWLAVAAFTVALTTLGALSAFHISN